jgi:DNA-binding MarR family transcriptional regulator
MSRYALMLYLYREERCCVREIAEWFGLSTGWVLEILRELGA